jgi:hypothetical protein
MWAGSPRHSAIPVLLHLTTMLAACGPGQDAGTPGDHVSLRDSAGIRIVESRAPRLTGNDAPRLSDEPVLQIGSVDGDVDQALFRVTQLGLLSDGNIVIVETCTTLRFFDPDGRFLRAVGGRGQGPGEFQYLQHLEILRGDTILAYDFGAFRVTLFDSAGTLIRTTQLALDEFMGQGTFVGRLRDGSYLVGMGSPRVIAELGNGVVKRANRIHRFAPDGASLGTALEYPVDHHYNGEGFQASPMFGPQGIAIVAGADIVTAFSDAFRLDFHEAPSLAAVRACVTITCTRCWSI